MKKITLILLSALTLSCATTNDYILSEDEMSKFNHDNDTISYMGKPLGYISNFEIEYNPYLKDKMIYEISVTVINRFDTLSVDKLLRYVHTRQPKAKVEINYDKKKIK